MLPKNDNYTNLENISYWQKSVLFLVILTKVRNKFVIHNQVEYEMILASVLPYSTK